MVKWALLSCVLMASFLGGCVVADERGAEGCCELHAMWLEEDAVRNPNPIRGSSYPWDSFERAKLAEFPHANTRGTYPTELLTYASVRYCEACREAQIRWLSEHQDRSIQAEERVARVREGAMDYRSGVPATCGMHGAELKEDAVPVAYGLPGLIEEGYMEAMPRAFPYAVTHVMGGCSGGGPTRALVKYCPECRVAQARWLRENGGVSGNIRPAYVGMLAVPIAK